MTKYLFRLVGGARFELATNGLKVSGRALINNDLHFVCERF